MPPTVVILLSDKRSGSTMFQDALCQHPEIRTVDYSPHTYLETHHWLKGTVLLDRPAKRNNSSIYQGYGTKANARTYMLDLLQGNLGKVEMGKLKWETGESNNQSSKHQPALDPRHSTLDYNLVFSGWEALCEKYAQPVFFEKSPQYLGFPASLDLMLEWVQKTEFTVKFIGLTRNPLSVQYSAWKLFHRDPGDRQFGWMELQQEMLEFEKRLQPWQFMHVKYEDIISTPVSTFADICRFIGVEPDTTVGAEVHGKSLTKWKDDPYFTVRLDPEVKAFARQFGYSDEELDNPEKPEPPLSWRLRKQLEAFYKLNRAKLKDRVLKPLKLRVKGSGR